MTYPESCWQNAHDSLGVQEEPKGSNWGRWVQTYLAFVGITSPAPWCCAFVVFKLYQAAQSARTPVQFPKTGSCSTLAAWARRNGRLLTHPDSTTCLFLVRARDHSGNYIEGEYEHIGFYRPTDSATIEGNTNTDGSAEGYEVAQRTRPASDRYHYIRIA